MPEEKKPVEGAEQPQEQEKPEDDKSPSEEEKSTEKPAETAQDDNAPVPESVPEQTESKTQVPESGIDTEALKEENFSLRAQLEAMKTGFLPDIIEDAVVLAKNIVNRDGGDISDALKAVAKKYPEWTAAAQNEKKSGFKVGVDSSGGTSTDDERLDAIFGIKKKTGGKK